MADRQVAQVFPPGEFIREELEARGWSQVDLAEILARPQRLVSELISAKRSISPETAKGLGEAFGTGGQFWMNLETAYQLAQVTHDDEAVAKRAKLYEKAPVKEMLRRNWIEPSDDIDTLEKRVLDFFQIESIHERPRLRAHAARKAASYADVTPAQLAWLYRARHLSKGMMVSPFSQKALANGLARIKELLGSAPNIRLLPKILADCGVRFIVVEALAHTKIDGVCFWLDDSAPVVVVTIRYDRIDGFWHTVLHELDHVRNEEGKDEVTIDTDLFTDQPMVGERKPEQEMRADEFACSFLIPPREMDYFIARVRPLYSKERIRGFAKRIGVHPGVVVGQLQHRGEISYAHNREMLEKIRHIVTGSTLTDGWGNAPIIHAA
jgi:HTH-type transcriptional regulator/antitoxin HigA